MKKYLIVILIVVMYLICVLVLPDVLTNKSYLIVGSSAKWVYQNGTWGNYTKIPTRLGRFKLYDINDGEYIGSTNLYYKNKSITAKDKELFNNRFILAYKGSGDIKFIPYTRVYDIASNEILDVMKKVGVSDTNIPLASKIAVDLDNDGADETIYEFYNSLNYDTNIKKYYSIICIKDGNEYTKLVDKTSNYTFYDNYLVTAIIDFTNDGNYEIIIGESGISFDARDASYSMYGLKDGKYVKLSTE